MACHVSGQHVVLTCSPLEQFELFKAEHSHCIVPKVSAVCTCACSVSMGVHVLLWQQPHCHIHVCLCMF